MNQSFAFNTYLLLFLIPLLALSSLNKARFKWRWIHGVLFSAFFLLLGYQVTWLHNDWNDIHHFRKHLSDQNLIIGIVDNPPTHKERSIQVNIKTQQIGQDVNSLSNCSGKLILWLRNDTINQAINYGDVLVFKTSIKSVRPNLNPEAFDFKRYLHFQNIHYQGFLPADQWQLLEEGRGHPMLTWAFKTRAKLIRVLKENVKTENEYAVASALILGYKEGLSEQLKNAYSSTGAMHVLAVSGLHVGVVWGIIAFLLKWIRWRHPAWTWIKTGLTIIALWLFALVTGASPSVLRAATMFSFLLVGTAMGRSTNIYNTLAASAFCLLLFDPYLLMSVGFQLSYLAVVGIVYFFKKIYNLWYIENIVGDYIWQLSAVAIAAQLSTFPLSLYYFHQFPVYFLLSGLVVIPFAFLILGLGLALFFTNSILPFLNPVLAKVLMLSIWLMNAVIFLIQQLPDDFSNDFYIAPEIMLLLYLSLLAAILAINTRKIKYAFLGLGVLLIIALMTTFRTLKNDDQKKLVFYYLDQKTYIECMDGKQILGFGDRAIKEKDLKFATENFHLRQQAKLVDRKYFGAQEVTNGVWFLYKNHLQFFDRKIAFVDTLPQKILATKIKVDYILFRKKSKVTINQLRQIYEFEKIIFDGALNQSRLATLKKACHEQNIPYYDINQEGALVLNLN